MKKILAIAIILIPFLIYSQVNDPKEYNKIVNKLIKMQKNPQKSQDENEQFDLIIKKVSGKVSIKSSENKDFHLISGYKYYPLEPDDIIKTGPNGYAELFFSNIGLIRMDRNSELEIRALEIDDANIFLKSGFIMGKFSKPKRRFSLKIITPAASCLITGTEFGAEHSLFGKETAFGVYQEGEISVFPIIKEKEGEEIKISSNQEITLSSESKRYKVSKLSRLSRYSGLLENVRSRYSYYQKKYKPMDNEKREELRQKLFADESNEDTKIKDKKNRKIKKAKK
jgi:hypothetical protein